MELRNLTKLLVSHSRQDVLGRDMIIIVLLLQVMGRGCWLIYVRAWEGWQGVGIIFFSIFTSVFALVLIVLSWVVHGSCVCFFVSFRLSLSLIRSVRYYWYIETVQ